MDLRFRRQVYPGGFADNLALSAISASAFMGHPIIGLSSMNAALAGMVLGGAGGAWAAKRVTDALHLPFFRGSNVKIRSDEPFGPKVGIGCRDGMTLGYTVDGGVPVTVPWDSWMRHCFVIGQSGVGKTVFGEWLMFQQIVAGGGLLWIDGKLDSDNLKKLDAMCAWAGRRADLQIINPGDPSASNSYNPILYGDSDEVSARVLSLIPSSESNPGTDYYRQAANQGISTLVEAIQASRKAYNFMDLAILLQAQKALSMLENLTPAGDARTALQLFLSQYKVANKDGLVTIDLKRLKETFGGVGGRMHMFGSGNFGMVTNTYTPEVNMYEAIRQNKIVYVALPTMGKAEAAANFGKMAVGDFRSAIAQVQALPKHERPWPPFLNFSDEAGSYVTPAWSRIFEQGRSAHLAMMPAIQTMANLEVISPELREMVVGNTFTKVFFKVGTDETAKQIVELIGNESRAALSTSASTGAMAQFDAVTGQRGGTSGSDSFGVSEREEEVEKVTSDMLKNLSNGEAFVTIGGSKVYHIKVPALSFSPSFTREIGPFSLNRLRPAYSDGLNLFRDAQKWLA